MTRYLFTMPIFVVGLCLGVPQVSGAPQAKEHAQIEGRNLVAYEAAAKFLREAGAKNGGPGLPEKWTKTENYKVAFEGESEGCYVMHFEPHYGKGAEKYLGYSPETGIPFRFYVRKSDLKVLNAVRE